MVLNFIGVACHGGSDEPLNCHLKRLTDSAYTRKTLGGNEIDEELIAPVIQESHDGEMRREIMRHLRECLSSDSSGKRWQRIYGGLALTEKLMQHGSPLLAIEVAHGHHFDLVQKVSFLELFDAQARGCTDRRAQNFIRSKAGELNAILVPLLQKAAAEELPTNMGLHSLNKDTASTCSKDTAAVSNSTGSTAASSSMTLTSNGSPASAESEPVIESGTPVVESDARPEPPPAPSTPSRKLKPRIDDAFSELREWMQSVDYNSGESARASPRGSVDSDGDSDWEPIGQLPARSPQAKPVDFRSPQKSDCGSSDGPDAFFTPLPTPAIPHTDTAAIKVAPTPPRSRFGRFMMSL